MTRDLTVWGMIKDMASMEMVARGGLSEEIAFKLKTQ